jgi:AcrR family transcriptional regulator
MPRKNVKELLIRTAIDLFSQRGYGETSIRDIGEKAKVNTSLFYYYFKDKEEILYTIIERSTRDLINALKEIQSTEADPLQCLRKMITRHISFSRENRKMTKIVTIEADQLGGQRKNHCYHLQREIYDIYKRQLQHLDRLNLVKEINLTVLNFVIFGMINWFYRWYKDEKPLSEEDVADQMIKIILFGTLSESNSYKGIQ